MYDDRYLCMPKHQGDILMYRIMILAAVMAMCITASAQNEGENGMQTENRALVVYFSATGTTAGVARMIADITGGKLYGIVPQQAYTAGDLDWNDRHSRSSVEMNDSQARPAMKGSCADTEVCNVVFIGYPIWWNQAPRIINTFIENHDLKGKTIVPFATSGGSGIAGSVKELRNTYPDLEWTEGRLLNGTGRNAIRDWVNDIYRNIIWK